MKREKQSVVNIHITMLRKGGLNKIALPVTLKPMGLRRW